MFTLCAFHLRRRLALPLFLARREAVMMRGWKVCQMHGARGGAPKGKRSGNYKHGARSMETIELWKRIKSLR